MPAIQDEKLEIIKKKVEDILAILNNMPITEAWFILSYVAETVVQNYLSECMKEKIVPECIKTLDTMISYFKLRIYNRAAKTVGFQ